MYGNRTLSIGYRKHNSRHQEGQDIQEYRGTSRETWVNSRNGGSVPGYQHKIRNVQNATSGFSAVSRDRFIVPITGYLQTFGSVLQPTVRVRYELRQMDEGNYPPTVPAGFNSGVADSIAKSAFISNYRAARTTLQSGVLMGELLETVRMISNPARALRQGVDRYYRDVKKRLGRNRKPSARKSVVRDTWLEYSFGWAPLVNDVNDACRLAAADPNRYTQVLTGFGASDFTEVARHDTQAWNTGWPYFTVYKKVRNSVTVRYKGCASAEMGVPPYSEQLGLSWSNLAPTMWELIPYSFLVDYFSNVGAVIEGLSTGSVFLAWGCRTARRVSISDIQSELNPVPENNSIGKGRWVGTVQGVGNTGHYRNIDRSSVSALSVNITDLRFRVPGVSTKWLNIAALASMRR